jgi:hypothetical protein
MIVSGSCICGRVGYEARLPFKSFVNCHCSRCRKATGSAYAANAVVAPEAFAWTKGESEVRRFDLPEARSFATAVCGRCGAPVPHATRSGREVIIPGGSLDQDPGLRPSRSAFWESGAPWMPPAGELPDSE